MQELEEELVKLKTQKEQKVRLKKKQDLKNQIDSLKAELEELDTKTQEANKDSQNAEAGRSRDNEKSKDIPSLKELRQLSGLQSKVEEHIAGAQYVAFADESDSSGEEEAQSMLSSKRGKKLKSGIEVKPTEIVKYPQVWPHCFLEYEFINKPLSYKELEFRHFVAGELEIVTSGVMKEQDAKFRMEHLKQAVYWEGIYEWEAILDLHAAKLRLIELGKKRWGDDFTRVETQMLQSAQKKRIRVEYRETKTYFCRDFNQGMCNKRSPHQVMVRGRRKVVQHICGKCFLKSGAIKNHSEQSNDCPNKEE